MTKHTGQQVGYIRVSTLDQNTARQDAQLEGLHLDEVFTDYASGKDTDRPNLQAAIKHLRKGDTLVIASMDRLARNLDDLRAIVSNLTSKGIEVKFLKESMTFTGEQNHIAELMLSILGAVAQFERSLIKERQREGIAIAKTNGVYKGRKPTMTEERIKELRVKDEANGFKNRASLARDFGISRETFYKYIQK
ncbi:MAG: recombinase family protein [Methylotenera sp.]|uniref:recombinase family protein n=1 Tax=Methylotenera sp. TaxID=2051956 RepID=UPI0024893457|nr:recombinase family protein [Methylotenera sp.]MDI1308236.1 recombinase family protein [Methylotenera sp.]